MSDPDLSGLESDEGWLHASSLPLEADGTEVRGAGSQLGWGGLNAHGRPAEAELVRTGVLAAIKRLGEAPELYAVKRAGELEPIALSNRRQAWTVGARWALSNRWEGRFLRSTQAA